MTMRTTDRIVTFHRPFCLNGVDRVLPPADYRVVTDEELIEGLSFVAYHRISTVIFVPAPRYRRGETCAAAHGPTKQRVKYRAPT